MRKDYVGHLRGVKAVRTNEFPSYVCVWLVVCALYVFGRGCDGIESVLALLTHF